jgi:hypothetical protein
VNDRFADFCLLPFPIEKQDLVAISAQEIVKIATKCPVPQQELRPIVSASFDLVVFYAAKLKARS